MHAAGQCGTQAEVGRAEGVAPLCERRSGQRRGLSRVVSTGTIAPWHYWCRVWVPKDLVEPSTGAPHGPPTHRTCHTVRFVHHHQRQRHAGAQRLQQVRVVQALRADKQDLDAPHCHVSQHLHAARQGSSSGTGWSAAVAATELLPAACCLPACSALTSCCSTVGWWCGQHGSPAASHLLCFYSALT